MDKYSLKQGFSLPEVLVGMAVMVLVVVAATNLLVSSIRGNVTNVNTLVAYGLAQEGIEAARSIRDSNWLIGAGFNGVIGGARNRTLVWGAELPSQPGDKRYFTVEANDSGNRLFTAMSGFTVGQLPEVAPWKLTLLSREEVESGRVTRLYKKENGALPGEVRYTHAAGARLSAQRRVSATPFRRYLVVEPQGYQVVTGVFADSASAKKLRVACIVEWEEMGRTRQVRLDGELTDWKQ